LIEEWGKLQTRCAPPIPLVGKERMFLYLIECLIWVESRYSAILLLDFGRAFEFLCLTADSIAKRSDINCPQFFIAALYFEFDRVRG